MKIPPFLSKGSTIGVAAPSFGATTEPYTSLFNEAVKKLTERGYTVIPGKCCFRNDGLGISTTPEAAARELEYEYTNPDFEAVISCGGGELMCETISCIDFNKLKDSPAKWFMGYSDNTNFIFPLVTISDTAAIYGPCFPTFGKPWEQSEIDALDLLEGTKTEVQGYPYFQSPEADSANTEIFSKYILDETKHLKSFICRDSLTFHAHENQEIILKGTLLGGCLDVLNNFPGTRFDNMKAFNQEHESIIWVLEACDCNPMDIRRCLWHLRESGWFEKTAGFLIGRPLAAYKQEVMGVNQYNAVTDILSKFNKPIICDVDVGHIDPAMPLVMGAEAEVKVINDVIQVKHFL